MTGWNLPPGCNVCDIPGNRDIDVAFEKYLDCSMFLNLCHDCPAGYDLCIHRINGTEDECSFVQDDFNDYYYRDYAYGGEEYDPDFH